MILEKLSQPKTSLDCSDLTPNQKKHLWVVMQRHEASQGFAYDRFFKEGFKEWELRGIDKIKQDFLRLHKVELSASSETDSTVGNICVPGFPGNEEYCFYDLIGKKNLKMAFAKYMSDLGMGSNTVLDRFGKSREKDFKDFERIGMLAVIREFEEEVEAQKIE